MYPSQKTLPTSSRLHTLNRPSSDSGYSLAPIVTRECYSDANDIPIDIAFSIVAKQMHVMGIISESPLPNVLVERNTNVEEQRRGLVNTTERGPP